jgi:hypothetical protein
MHNQPFTNTWNSYLPNRTSYVRLPFFLFGIKEKALYMKKFVIASLLVFTFLLNGCDPAATFDKPQPDNVKTLASFPKRIQGKYISVDQSSTVTITDNLVTRHYNFEGKEHKDSIGTSYKLVGETLVDQTDGTKEAVIIKGDSIIRRVNWTDTLFSITDKNVLKKFKGYYFLNLLHGDKAWEVKKLSLQKSILSVGNISEKDDIQKLKEITETTTDTTTTHFALSKRQFKKFVSQDGFGQEETFTRIAENSR